MTRTSAHFYRCPTCGALFWQPLARCTAVDCPATPLERVHAAGQWVAYRQPDGDIARAQIVRALGHGGTATVFEAAAWTRAVIKLPRRELFTAAGTHTAGIKEELAREFRMLLRIAQTGNPYRYHLPEPLGAGLLADGVPFLVMRFADGVTLADIIDEAYEDLRTPPPLSTVLTALLGAARALSVLHAHGIVHRDVKSNNIVVPLGRPELSVLVDLGTAKPVSGEQDLSLSRDLGPQLNRLYAAPEYVHTGVATPASDLYALGATAFEALTGRMPGEVDLAHQLGRTALEVDELRDELVQERLVELRAQRPPSFPAEARQRWPAELVDLTEHLMQPRPADRPSSTRVVVARLEALAGKAGVKPIVLHSPLPEEGERVESAAASASRVRRRAGIALATLALGVAVVAAASALLPASRPLSARSAPATAMPRRPWHDGALHAARRRSEPAVTPTALLLVARPPSARLEADGRKEWGSLLVTGHVPGEHIDVLAEWPTGQVLHEFVEVPVAASVVTLHRPRVHEATNTAEVAPEPAVARPSPHPRASHVPSHAPTPRGDDYRLIRRQLEGGPW